MISQNGLSLILLAGLVIAVVFLLVWIWRRPLNGSALSEKEWESGESVVTPRALMSTEEATLYNLIVLAVRDHRLVLAKIPILQVLSFSDTDEEARKSVMRTIQSVRCDVILAHPGTLKTTTVISFKKNSSEAGGRADRDRLVTTLLQAAGIHSIVLELNQMYSIDRLTEMLGLAEEE